MEKVDFNLTSAAKHLLEKYSRDFDLENHVTAVMWEGKATIFMENGEPVETSAGWGVGWVSKEKIVGVSTRIIDGIEFLIDQSGNSKRLDSMVLDVKDNSFVVREEE